MDQVSFQNGFVCGLATKGLVRSGQLYEPTIWNDSGEYSFFYIDFRRSMQSFSIGMLTESIIVHESQQIAITNFKKVNETTYKIYANISGLFHGITVVNKKTSRLRFSTGEKMPVFSIHMFVAGITGYLDGGYFYDQLSFANQIFTPTESNINAILAPSISTGPIAESVSYNSPTYSTSENSSVILT